MDSITIISLVINIILIGAVFYLQKSKQEEVTKNTKLTYDIDILIRESELKEESFNQRFQAMNEAKNSMKLEFKEMAEEILKGGAETLSAQNSKAIETVLAPFDREFKVLKERIETVHTEDTKQRTALQSEILSLQKSSHDVNQTANDLANALKGDVKSQGKWGELVLENVLDESGLRKEHDYKLEVSHTTEEGRKRPDAIVYMPGDKHIIVDAKTSLRAYTAFVNEQDETLKDEHLKQHLSNVWDRINELAERKYEEIEEFNSPDAVIMFMPIESAYIEAVKADKTIFQTAIEKNIVIATPSTLLATLNIIKQIWRHEAQSKNAAKLADQAQKLSSKFALYIESVDKLGKTLERAQEDHKMIYHHLVRGKGNLMKRINDFEELGVKVQKSLPQDLLEQADLEIE